MLRSETKSLNQLVSSPELVPITINFSTRTIWFARLQRENLRKSTFVAVRAATRCGTEFCELRLDDVSLAARALPDEAVPVHYIFHTAYCCSTLLSRYFELVPGCLVLKEPQALAQCALAWKGAKNQLDEETRLVLRLLKRQFHDETVIIKTNVPCNAFAAAILEAEKHATATFLFTPIREFILSVLKLPARAIRVRSWNRHMQRSAMIDPRLASVNLDHLTDAEAAAYWWSCCRHICDALTQAYSSRVVTVNGKLLAEHPQRVLAQILQQTGLRSDEAYVEVLIADPLINSYSKDASQPFNSRRRQSELEALERQFGSECDAAIDWALRLELAVSDYSVNPNCKDC